MRLHYVFISSISMSLLHWGSGNIYHKDKGGKPIYDFTIVDNTYDNMGLATTC